MFKTPYIPAAVSAAAIAFASAASQAQPAYLSEVYVGGNVTMLDVSGAGITDEANPFALYGRLGAFVHPYLSGEVRLGIGVGDDEAEFTVGSADIELDHMYGLYARGGFPVNETFYPYALVGWTWTEIESSGTASDTSTDVDDFSYGIGADIAFPSDFAGGIGEGLKVNVEYAELVDQDAGELSGFTIGLVKEF